MLISQYTSNFFLIFIIKINTYSSILMYLGVLKLDLKKTPDKAKLVND